MSPERYKTFNNASVLPWFLLVLTVGFLLQIIFINAPLQSDDTTYFATANNLSLETFRNAVNQSYLRTGILFPAYAAIKIFGYNIVSYYILSVGFASLLVASIFLLTNRLIGLYPAVASCLLYSFSTYGLFQTTNFLPDVPNLVFLLLSFYFFSIAIEKKGMGSKTILILAAFFGFYAYLVRMPNSIFLVCIPIYEYLTRKSIKNSIVFFSGFFAFWLLESLFYLMATGNFLLRLSLISKGVSSWEIYQDPISWTDYLAGPFKNLLSYNSGLLLLPCGFLGAVAAFRKKHYGLI